jgi:hypothetical protein
MNRTLDSHGFSHSSPPADGAPQASTAPRRANGGQALFRLDLKRSLRMHRGLVLGSALIGLVLAMTYVVLCWPVSTGQSLVNLQPTPPAHTAHAAVPRAHASDVGVIRNALLLLFGFMGIGVAAAIARHKMDPRVYIASDVEDLLGFAPMAQLPDFDEVSDEVARDHLLRLASAIEHAAKDRQLRNCVFTGAGLEVGVTTIAGRVKEMLGALGKPDLLLIDAAPLAASARAERMARQADCIILVIESGKITRAQLRASAASLDRLNAARLNAAAVGCVLNRISLADADESFRHSVSETERHLRGQRRAASWAVARSPRFVSQAALAVPVRRTLALTENGAQPAALAAPAAPPAASAISERVDMGTEAFPRSEPLPESPVLEQEREPHPTPMVPDAPRNIDPISLLLAGQSRPAAPEQGSAAPAPLEASAQPDESAQPEVSPAGQAPDPVPWWPSEASARDAAAFIQSRSSRAAAERFLAADTGQKPAEQEPQAEEAADYEAPTRLSALRGLFFPAGAKDASPANDTALNNAAASDSDGAMPIQPIAPQPMQDPADARGERAVLRGSVLHWEPAEPESPPLHPEAAGEELPAKKSPYNESALDSAQIRPARPGQ